MPPLFTLFRFSKHPNLPDLANRSSCSCPQCPDPLDHHLDWEWVQHCTAQSPNSATPPSPSSSSSVGSAAWWRSSWRPASPPCSSSCSTTPSPSPSPSPPPLTSPSSLSLEISRQALPHPADSETRLLIFLTLVDGAFDRWFRLCHWLLSLLSLSLSKATWDHTKDCYQLQLIRTNSLYSPSDSFKCKFVPISNFLGRIGNIGINEQCRRKPRTTTNIFCIKGHTQIRAHDVPKSNISIYCCVGTMVIKCSCFQSQSQPEEVVLRLRSQEGATLFGRETNKHCAPRGKVSFCRETLYDLKRD